MLCDEFVRVQIKPTNIETCYLCIYLLTEGQSVKAMNELLVSNVGETGADD